MAYDSLNIKGRRVFQTNVDTQNTINDSLDERITALESFGAKNVRVASLANTNIANNVLTMDGVTLADGDLVLLKNQSTGTQNGIYTRGTDDKLTRVSWADSTADLAQGLVIHVLEGDTQADTFWQMTNDAPTLGTDALVFASFDAYGATSENTANKIAKRDENGNFAAGTITANLIGGVTGDCSGNAGTATKLATGSIFKSTEQTGTGSAQNIAHGLGATPSLVIVLPSLVGTDGVTITEGTHDGTNCVVTATTGAKYFVVAIK